nr:unnamed protein product [Spirometra erinaceieuropaei]
MENARAEILKAVQDIRQPTKDMQSVSNLPLCTGETYDDFVSRLNSDAGFAREARTFDSGASVDRRHQATHDQAMVIPLAASSSSASRMPERVAVRRREPSLEERIKEQMHDAFLHIKNNRLEDADTALHALLLSLDEATRTGQLTNDAWLSRRARVYSELANLKLLQKDYPAAERLFVHTIRDCTASGVPPGSPMIIELSLKLAMVYSKLADSEKAESGFAFCLMMQQQNCSAIPLDDDDGKPLSEEDLNNLALLGAVQNAYAHYEVLEGRLPAGRKLLEAALKTARRVYAPNHLNCVHLLADLANVESQLDMPKNARSRLKEAVSLVLSATPASKREKQESDVALFNLYCQWAVLEGNQGAFKTAKKYLTEAKLLSANLPGDTDSQRRYSKQISKLESMLKRWQGMEANCEELLVPSDEA